VGLLARVGSALKDMDRLAKWLFPKIPRMVRRQRLQLFYWTIFLSIIVVALVGGLYYLMGTRDLR
jgi:hypothetical protein